MEGPKPTKLDNPFEPIASLTVLIVDVRRRSIGAGVRDVLVRYAGKQNRIHQIVPRGSLVPEIRPVVINSSPDKVFRQTDRIHIIKKRQIEDTQNYEDRGANHS